MHVHRLIWSDNEKSREVEIHVKYRLTEDGVRIEKLTPTKVTLYCSETKAVTKVLPVTRPTGQRLLAQAYELSRAGGPGLEEELLEQHLAV